MKHPIHEHLERRRIYLFRHAEAIDSKSGSMDYPGEKPLTERGRVQAAAMAEFLKDVHFDLAISSDFQRARETAEIILAERKGMLETSEYFRELDTELKKLMAGATNLDEGLRLMVDCLWEMVERFPEDIEKGAERVSKAVGYLLQKDWTVALVAAHSGFNRVFLCHLLGMPVKYMSVFEQDYSGMSIIELDVDIESRQLVRGMLRELNVTAYNPAKNDSLLIDIEKLAIETKPLMEKLFSGGQ